MAIQLPSAHWGAKTWISAIAALAAPVNSRAAAKLGTSAWVAPRIGDTLATHATASAAPNRARPCKARDQGRPSDSEMTWPATKAARASNRDFAAAPAWARRLDSANASSTPPHPASDSNWFSRVADGLRL